MLSSHDPLEQFRHHRIQADCRKILLNMSLADQEVDGVITDPPYDHLEAHRAIGTTTRLVTDWFPTMTMDEIKRVFELLHMILREHKHIYVFSNALAVRDMIDALTDVGFKYNNLLVWDKVKMGMGYNYRNQVEFIIFASKWKREKLKKNPRQLFRYPKAQGSPPYAKPWMLYRKLLECFTEPDDLIIDPFAGTDPLTKAAMDLGRRSISIDIKFPEAHLVVPRSVVPINIPEVGE